MTRRRGGLAAPLLTLLLFWLVGYPLVLTLTEALGGPHWTLAHVAEFARRPAEWEALWASLWISLATVVLAGAIGVPLAFLFERNEFPGRGLLGALVALPVALPPLIGVLAFLFLYGESGFVSRGAQALFGLSEPPWRLSGPGAILFVHAYSMYVYFYLFTRAGLARADGSLLEAAASLGASRSRAIRRITLPLLMPALAGAALLTFMTSLASFSAPYIFGGSFRVMTTQIVASKLNGDDAMAMVETVALALIGFAGLALLRRAERRREVAGGMRGVAPRRRQLARGKSGRDGRGWALAILLLLPHATLVLVSLVPRNTWTTEALPPVLDLGNYRSLFSETERLRPIVNSLWMASAATALAILLGFAAASLAVRRRGRWSGPARDAHRRALGSARHRLCRRPRGGLQRARAVGRALRARRDARHPAARLPRAQPAAHRPRRLRGPAADGPGPRRSGRVARRVARAPLPADRPAADPSRRSRPGASLAFLAALGDFVVSIVLYTYDTRPISIEILSSLRIQEIGAAAAYGVLLTALSAVAFLVWGRRTEA